MTIAQRIDEIVHGLSGNRPSASLHARIIELLVLDSRTTPQGLAASLQQQIRLIHQHDTGAPDPNTVEQTLQNVVSDLQLQPRLLATPLQRRKASRQAAARLAARHPWPTEPPPTSHAESHHFTQPGTLELVGQAIDELDPEYIVEVGAWLGGSTQWLLNRFPGTLVSIDTWLGSQEHQSGTAWHDRRTDHASLLNQLFETFLSHCWEFRERLIAMRTSSLDGFWQIKSSGLSPEIILLDGAHDELSVADELELAHRLFPNARLIIDDYNRERRWLRGVVRAVDRFASNHRLTIIECDGQACMLVE